MGGEKNKNKTKQTNKKQKTNKQQNGGRGLVGRQSEGLGVVVWVYKIGLK